MKKFPRQQTCFVFREFSRNLLRTKSDYNKVENPFQFLNSSTPRLNRLASVDIDSGVCRIRSERGWKVNSKLLIGDFLDLPLKRWLRDCPGLPSDDVPETAGSLT